MGGITSGPPDKLSTAAGTAPSYSARAWVNFNGVGAGSIRASGNVSSVTYNTTGDYTVNFSTAIQDTNYVALCTTESDSVNDARFFPVNYYQSRATSSVRVTNGYPSTMGKFDSAYMAVTIFR